MAHYSEMEFLFSDPVSNESVIQQLNKTSNSNTFNILKEPDLSGSRPGYVLFKSKTSSGNGTSDVKNVIKNTVYKNEQNSTNPYINLINDFSFRNGTDGAGLRLRAADFAYLYNLGVYPMNRMAILRRFPEGVYVPEDLGTMKYEPISTIVGWIPDDKNFSMVSFNETWSRTNERFDVVLSEIIKKNTGSKVDISAIVPIPDFAQGVLFELYKRTGLEDSSGVNDSFNSAYEQFPNTNVDKNSKKTEQNPNTWGLKNIPVGDPNVLQDAPFRNPEGQNIKSDFTFELEATYEQKLLGDVDPGSAMLDILDNIYAMGTSNMVFYWGDGSKIVNDAKTAVSEKGGSLYDWWEFVVEITTSFWKTLTNLLKKAVASVTNTAKELFSDSGKSGDQKNQSSSSQNEKTTAQATKDKARAETNMAKLAAAGKTNTPEYKSQQSSRDYNDKILKKSQGDGVGNADSSKSLVDNAKNIGKDLLNSALEMLDTILTSTIAIHRFRLRGSIELMVGGVNSSAPWHLTIGNPYSPWLNTSHIIIESATVESSNEMGFNDMPQRLTAKFTCKFSRNLGKQELLRMFNNTYRRTYSKPPNSAASTTTISTTNASGEVIVKNGETIPVANASQTTPGTNGNGNDPSIVNYLNSKNQNSTYSARKQIAANMGIKNYKGTAEQNTQILTTLRNQSNA